MVYVNLYWWQLVGDFDVNILNLHPVDDLNGIPPDINFNDFDAVVLFPRLAYSPLMLIGLDRQSPVKLRDYKGIKVLFRQDENYITSSIINFVNNNYIDILFTCVPSDQVHLVYGNIEPTTKIVSVLTGYIEPHSRSRPRADFRSRDIDLFYRAHLGPFSAGKIVWDKYRIGAQAKSLLGNRPGIDISIDRKDRLYGQEWGARLDRSKAVLASESGSNVFDFDGAIYRWAAGFCATPDPLNYDACEHSYNAAMTERIGALEGKISYAQVSPRHFEAASHGCAQIMFPGKYSNIFQKGSHYIELSYDLKNIDLCLEQITDYSEWVRLTTCAFDEIVMNKSYWVEEFIQLIESNVSSLYSEKNCSHSAPKPGHSVCESIESHTYDNYVQSLRYAKDTFGSSSPVYISLIGRIVSSLIDRSMSSYIFRIIDEETGQEIEHSSAIVSKLICYNLKSFSDGDIDKSYSLIVSGLIRPSPRCINYFWTIVLQYHELNRHEQASKMTRSLIKMSDPIIRSDPLLYRAGLLRVFSHLYNINRPDINRDIAMELLSLHCDKSNRIDLALPLGLRRKLNSTIEGMT